MLRLVILAAAFECCDYCNMALVTSGGEEVTVIEV